VAVLVGHQFHQQHAFQHVVRLRHAHAGGGKAVQGVHFGALPGVFLFLAAVARALLDGARAAAVLDLAALGVLCGLMEAALVGFLVHLGAADLFPAAHHIDHRFLAALQLAQDFVDEAFLDERQQSLGGFDLRLSWSMGRNLAGLLVPDFTKRTVH
jgi:hypothetical protein